MTFEGCAPRRQRDAVHTPATGTLDEAFRPDAQRSLPSRSCSPSPYAAPARAADASAAAATTPAWVATSNGYAQILLKAQGPFQPEQLSFLGVPGYDDQVFDFGPDNPARFRAAMTRAKAELLAKSAGETDPNVRQDIAILTRAADDAIEASAVNERLVRPFADVGQTVFQGLQGLLNDQTQPERRALAIKRLQRYTGLAPGSTALATLARQRYDERSDPKLLQPTQVEVQQSLDNLPTYIGGIRDLFAKYHVDAGPEIDALQKQLDDYAAWTKTTVLPHARTTYSLPPELYALQLKNVGIDIDPRALIERAEFEFMEIRGGDAAARAAGGEAERHRRHRLPRRDPCAEAAAARAERHRAVLPQHGHPGAGARHRRASHRQPAEPADADAPGQRRRKRRATGPALPARAAGRQHRPAGHLRADGRQSERQGRRRLRRLQLSRRRHGR